MILTEQDIAKLYKEKPKHIQEMKDEHNKLLMHVHGVNVGEYITKLEGLENDTKIAIRKRLSRSNRDLFADILRPCDKIFNSNGGAKTYKFRNVKLKDTFQDQLSRIWEGSSLAQWLGMYFIDKLVTDPNGMFMIEHKDNNPYPTYKSINTIRSYKITGRRPEYILFEPYKVKVGSEEVDVFRVYDDSGDYLYRVTNESIVKLDMLNGEETSFTNPWGYVPAVTCSDIVNTLNGCKRSTIYEQVELADEYLRESSVKTLFKYHHGFPMYWQYLPTCPTCKGEGYINDTPCPTCKGTKYAVKKDVSDVTYLRQPESKDDPTVAPNLAGYVVPPIDSWRQMTEELKNTRDLIYFSHWGTVINREDKEKTAYEVAINTQPMQDRLNRYTESLENTEKKLVDIIAEYWYSGSYEGCSINYGRNYVIKSPNQYLTEYLDEKTKGSSYTVLNGKLEMYYNALYANDELERTYHLKLIRVEPFIHNTITEVIGWNRPELSLPKIYYNEWLSHQIKDDIITKEVEQLQGELAQYATQEYKLKQVENDTKKVQ